VTRAMPAATGGVVRVATDEDAIVNAVEIASPAAVKLVAIHEPRAPTIFDLFFGTTGYTPSPGIGSGFIFRYEDHNYILTNTHVVSAPDGGIAEKIRVRLADGEVLDGALIGADRKQDIAAIKVVGTPADLPVVELGDSDDLRVGEWVIAIGNPFDFEHTVTVGVVSAIGPRPVAENVHRDLIQTDAAINQGNSGGPLVNLAGQVVGINTMIFSPTGTSIGIGFAIPINQAKEMLYFLIHRGPWIGLAQLYPNSPGFAKYIGLDTGEGVVVVKVDPRSPAGKAGVRQADVILKVNGQEVHTGEDVQTQVRRLKIGDVAVLTIQRGREMIEVPVKTGRMPEERFVE
ncbi:MAG: S1C family serine protease, partial [Armatimonadota bacterium]